MAGEKSMAGAMTTEQFDDDADGVRSARDVVRWPSLHADERDP